MVDPRVWFDWVAHGSPKLAAIITVRPAAANSRSTGVEGRQLAEEQFSGTGEPGRALII
jgi:hypothetical protein